MEDDFLEQENWYRFCKVSNIVAVYFELLNYEPFKYVLNVYSKIKRDKGGGGDFYLAIYNPKIY